MAAGCLDAVAGTGRPPDPASGSWALRHGQRADPDDPFAGLAGHRPRRDGDPSPAGRLDELLEGGAQAVGVDVDAVDDQQRLGAVEGAAQGAAGAVAGGRLGADAVQAGRQDRVGGAQPLGVDPRRRLGARREVADQQRLAAARWSDHADPARARQRVVELEVDALAPQTGGQHGRNLSRRTPVTPDMSAVRGQQTYVSDLGRTTDAGARPVRERLMPSSNDRADRGTVWPGGDEREVREVAVEPGGPRPLVRRGTYAAPGVVRQGSGALAGGRTLAA